MRRVRSRVTLAFFEDTGWYKANYSMAQTAHWGYKAGCAFATQPCLSGGSRDGVTPPVSTEPNHFCNTPGAEMCTVARESRGYCSTRTFTEPIPPYFQYFPSNAALGGYSKNADFCPLVAPLSFQSSVYGRRSSCTDPTHAPRDNTRGETYGTKSRCFQTSLSLVSEVATVTTTSAPASTGTGWYEYACNETSLYINVVNPRDGVAAWLSCPHTTNHSEMPAVCPDNTDAVTKAQCHAMLALFTGNVYCPANATRELCLPEYEGCPNLCGGRGTCITDTATGGRRCVCTSGFGGADCTTQQCPNDCSGNGRCRTVMGSRAGATIF